MTKLVWDKGGRREADPGAVIHVEHSGIRPLDDSVPYEPKRQRAKRLARERDELFARSESLRLKALAEKKAKIAQTKADSPQR